MDVEADKGKLTMTSGTVTVSKGGNIRYAATGNIALGLLNAGAGNVSVSSSSGNITETDSGTGTDVLANRLRLEAGGSIGTAGGTNALDTQVKTLSAKSGGSTHILEADGLTLDDTEITVKRVNLDSTTTDVTDAALARAGESDGVFKVQTTDGHLTVSKAIKAGTDVLLLADGAGKNLTVNANVTAGDDIGLRAQNNVVVDDLGADRVVLVKSNGTADDPNNNNNNGGTIDIEAFKGKVAMAGDSTAEAVSGDIRVAADKSVTLGNLTTLKQVLVHANGNVSGGRIDADGAQVESQSGSINITTKLNDLAVRALGDIEISESDSLNLAQSSIAKVDRVTLDQDTEQVITGSPLDPSVAVDSLKGDIKITTHGDITQTDIIRVNSGLISTGIDASDDQMVAKTGRTTLDSGDAGDIYLTERNQLNRLTVSNARNVAINDINSDGDTKGIDTDGTTQGLTVVGSNKFKGTAFVVATEGGMRFSRGKDERVDLDPGKKVVPKYREVPKDQAILKGTAGSTAVLIAGDFGGASGTNETTGNLPDPDDIPDSDLDIKTTNTYLIANSLSAPSASRGSYLIPFFSSGDPIKQLIFNYQFPSGGVKGVFEDAVDGMDFGSSLGSRLDGVSGDAAALFNNGPVIDLAMADAAELARSFFRKGVTGVEVSASNVQSSVDRGVVDKADGAFDYYGPYWTIGYDYELYLRERAKAEGSPFPLYYYYDASGKLVYVLSK